MSYPSDPTTPHRRAGKAFQAARFAAALAWAISSRLLADSSARGLTTRLNVDVWQPFLSGIFLLFLLGIGYFLLETIARRPASMRSVLGLPTRSTAGEEWLTGAAIGWGMVILAVLPMALTNRLHVTFWTEPGTLRLLIANIFSVAAASLAIEVIFRGYPFRCLVDGIGPVAATLCMTVLYALAEVMVNGASSTGVLVALLMGVLFSVAWFRTHGLWLAWGMHFAWTASMGILFGLPVGGRHHLSVLVATIARGSRWLTGGRYGPEAARFTLVALAIGLVVLVRVTRDYAWNYTHPPIVPGGYPMEAKPPAEHVAMEQAAQSRPPALVQILPSTPQGPTVNHPPGESSRQPSSGT
ncbi:CPBP family intramembrane glutamic endopeptidase [Edaphobacter sp. 12200R-103]|uniref:CPBP family intramembrane glutamic endopeptidase n=1 Tax=Edaphobacter sp. 12200R-103 TaxID=2703788 RepID=UPI00138BE450|nr:type II CAAX endopeptidase family protein [Edaphobacter sp. 12200R-103]QHS51051.1 CPBP family intramembrane metalloprotease [Edaphobacter sp. 12200R-103]